MLDDGHLSGVFVLFLLTSCRCNGIPLRAWRSRLYCSPEWCYRVGKHSVGWWKHLPLLAFMLQPTSIYFKSVLFLHTLQKAAVLPQVFDWGFCLIMKLLPRFMCSALLQICWVLYFCFLYPFLTQNSFALSSSICPGLFLNYLRSLNFVLLLCLRNTTGCKYIVDHWWFAICDVSVGRIRGRV